MVIPIYEHYEKVRENGCDRNHECETCELFQKKRNECIIEESKKWEAWNEAEHKRFGELLK